MQRPGVQTNGFPAHLSLRRVTASTAVMNVRPPPSARPEERTWKLRSEFLSPRYTTDWDELLRVARQAGSRWFKSNPATNLQVTQRCFVCQNQCHASKLSLGQQSS